MHVRVLDLDGSVARRDGLGREPAVVPMGDWGPRIRICCSFRAFGRFERDCGVRCGDPPGPAATFLGSGDFHHVTVALLRRVAGPFNLLVLDKHPDWTRGAPLMHCGTWVPHALALPGLARMFQVGAALDLENALYHFAPWRELRSGRVALVPAVHRLARGRWPSLAGEPLREEPGLPMGAGRAEEVLGRFRADLASRPLYISVDKDVMRASDAPTNWDAGHLDLDEVLGILTWFVEAAAGRVVGMDVVGDWSVPRTRGLLRTMLERVEHPRLDVDPGTAAEANARANRAILETVEGAIARSAQGTGVRRPPGAVSGNGEALP